MKKKNWVVIALCIAIVGMGIGFAALAQNLQINATANITGEWDVRITDVVIGETSGIPAENISTFDGTSATFEVNLPHPGAYIQYEMWVVNNGNIDAILNSITGITAVNSAEPSEIQFTVAIENFQGNTSFSDVDTNFGSLLNAGSANRLRVRAEWVANPDGESIIPDEKSKTATINFNYIQNT